MLSCTEYSIIFLSIFLIIVVRAINYSPRAILNVYQRPNGLFWVKTCFMYVVLLARKLKKKNSHIYLELEKPQTLSYHDLPIDGVYFNGASSNGDHLVVGTARRKNNLIDAFMYIKINASEFGLLETLKLPDTSLYQDETKEEWNVEGIKITPVEAMKKWDVYYDGKMKDNKNTKYDVKLRASWTTNLPIFNFDHDMDPWAMAKSMAYETWSKEYFKNLEENHQTHYEQHGQLEGVVTVNGTDYKLDLNTVRDHSFGVKREWRNFHRYGLHFFSAQNGDRFSVGMICMPISFSRLTMGYVYSKEDDKIYPVSDCDLQLYQHGENAEPPKDYAFSFCAGGKKYTVQVNVVDCPYFYLSKDWESKVVERLCKFKVNGVEGWGAAEWQYRNIQGRFVNK
ncbi:unnamed protein product [Brassicogethes aeneus]|uniref:DUF7064 domain-containing protein n=1 Tax=Brassicogethes aeneus TaxID=1431903 RepID=A0A9P0B5R4_BRAAE|nr:unnamed protein product [Brassicogethes aeneus]